VAKAAEVEDSERSGRAGSFLGIAGHELAIVLAKINFPAREGKLSPR